MWFIIYTRREKYLGINFALEYSLYYSICFKSLKSFAVSLCQVIPQLFSLRIIKHTLNNQPRLLHELEEVTTYIAHELLGALIVCNTQDLVGESVTSETKAY